MRYETTRDRAIAGPTCLGLSACLRKGGETAALFTYPPVEKVIVPFRIEVDGGWEQVVVNVDLPVVELRSMVDAGEEMSAHWAVE